MNFRKVTLMFVSILVISILSACGASVEQDNTSGEGTSGNASGIMLAGQDAPEIVGTLKSIEANVEVIITVDGQDVNYRISEDATAQIEGEEVGIGSEVTFTTFSIGNGKDTVAEFIIK